ncbi:hypothetical protein FGO68_gene13018 [Halteria grandinella]|uniref:Uncharacterized protein n=1 Tax=Halteria grandinella TaxID=5974 RepID=A0A8J8T6F2_HALGN|nr:hypothetical protein FGO68_gene13018 [Halteria grandinella]
MLDKSESRKMVDKEITAEAQPLIEIGKLTLKKSGKHKTADINAYQVRPEKSKIIKKVTIISREAQETNRDSSQIEIPKDVETNASPPLNKQGPKKKSIIKAASQEEDFPTMGSPELRRDSSHNKWKSQVGTKSQIMLKTDEMSQLQDHFQALGFIMVPIQDFSKTQGKLQLNSELIENLQKQLKNISIQNIQPSAHSSQRKRLSNRRASNAHSLPLLSPELQLQQTSSSPTPPPQYRQQRNNTASKKIAFQSNILKKMRKSNASSAFMDDKQRRMSVYQGQQPRVSIVSQGQVSSIGGKSGNSQLVNEEENVINERIERLKEKANAIQKPPKGKMRFIDYLAQKGSGSGDQIYLSNETQSIINQNGGEKIQEPVIEKIAKDSSDSSFERFYENNIKLDHPSPKKNGQNDKQSKEIKKLKVEKKQNSGEQPSPSRRKPNLQSPGIEMPRLSSVKSIRNLKVFKKAIGSF